MREGLSFGQLSKAQGRVGAGKAARLEWAVRFATEPWDGLPSRRRRQRQGELLAFTHEAIVAGRVDRIPLPGAEETRTIQIHFLRILERLITDGRTEIGLARVQVGRSAGKAWLSTEPLTDDLEAEAVFTLGELLGSEGHRVKRCAAPQHVQRTDVEPCGRWFVGRPNRNHCSAKCANLASTRAARFGRDEERYRGYVIRSRSRRLQEGRWQAWMEYSSPIEGHTYGGPITMGLRRTFNTKEEADQLAIRAAKALIERKQPSVAARED